MENLPQQHIVQQDSWTLLKAFTAARIALGRTGCSIPLQENLQFKLAHAHARDAVFSALEMNLLMKQLAAFLLPILPLQSQCNNRNEYLQRPDFGRRLNETSQQQLLQLPKQLFDIAIVLADGLSATAINQHALPLLEILLPLLQKSNMEIAPLCIVQQGRVAIADEVGSLLQAKLSLILIGERPGLSSPDSMGAYITYHPTVGLTDESRNCISNIRPQGLPLALAAEKIYYLIQQSLVLKLSGVTLKDNGRILE